MRCPCLLMCLALYWILVAVKNDAWYTYPSMLCALFVYVVSIIRSFCGVVSHSQLQTVKKRTEISNPTLRASSFSSSKLSSTDASPELLFSQCHSRGPDKVRAKTCLPLARTLYLG